MSSTDRDALLQDLLPLDEEQAARIADVRERTAEEAVLVHRRALPVLTTRLPDSLPAWAAGLKVERVIGPVRDQFGRDTFFDIFRRVRQVQFVRSAGEPPFLTVPLSQLSIAVLASSTSLNLAAGSFWIATKLLAAAAGDGVYTGLRIARGRVQFDQPVTFSGDQVIVPTTTGCRVDLDLAPPPAPGGTGPGRDVRESLFQPPRNVRFEIGAASASVTVMEPCALRVYDQQVGLAPPAGAATYLPIFNRVKIPLAPMDAQFTVGTVHSTSLRPEGSARITGGGWALPAARIAPADLGEASGVGALMLELGEGLSATWTGQAEAVPLESTLLFLDEARLATASFNAHAYGVAQHPELPEVMERGRIALAWNHNFPLTYFAQANGVEAVFSIARFRASLEKPVDVNGDRVSVDAPATVIFIENADGRFLSVAGEMPPSRTYRRLAFGLRNGVLRANLPITFNLLARYDGAKADEGILALGYRLAGIVPSLPDPYATNAVVPREDNDSERFTSLSWWRPAETGLEFLLPAMPNLPSGRLDVTPDQAIGMVRSGPIPPSVRGILGIISFFSSRAFRPEVEIESAKEAMGDALTFESIPRLILLDLSTNVSQFGVALRTPNIERRAFWTDPPKPLAVQDLNLVIDGRFLTLLTLPAVQWEPASGEPVPEIPQFPPGVTFAKNGVPSLVDVPTVNLVPVTPDAALDTILDNFEQPDPRPSRARFTLPFGMIANADLTKPGPQRGAKVSEHRPTAIDDDLQGVRQLRIDAADPSLAADRTPALPGFTVQFPVATPTDNSPGPRSILGTSVTDIFNDFLGAHSPNRLVPVTRIDLTGYGESLFSAWHNPVNNETAVAKAEFKVLNGRVAHEVVQVRSILLPYFLPVVRTITLERKNNAFITRHDSGWLAAGDGAYESSSGIETHPGAVTRITNVTHIRETGDRVTKNGFTFVGVRYQGDVVLDGAPKPVPVKNHFGYVKLSTTDLTAAAYAALVRDEGPLCGPIDTGLNVGGGPQVMRLHRIGVGVTQPPAPAPPQFAMTAWGGLVFPGGGEWSILQTADALGAPQPVPKDEGLPIVRAKGNPTWRFADPADLLRPNTPARDYGILHATGTQRAFFRRPRIESTNLARIVGERPVIADPYVMATALGPFPKQSDCIPFPPVPWALAVDGGGNYRLDMPATFPANVGRRTMKQSGTVKRDLDYSISQVTYTIDTSQPVPWRFELTKARSIMHHTGMLDLITLTADVKAQAGRETVFDQPEIALGKALDFVQDLIDILESLGIAGILRTVMTNEWALHASVKIPFVDAMGNDLQVPPFDPHPMIKFADTGISITVDVAPENQGASFEISGRPMFAIKSIPGLYVVAIIGFKIQLSTKHGTMYTLTLGVGVAYELEAGPFGLKGLLAITFFAVFGDNIAGYGVGFLVKVSAEIAPIISIELSLEGKLARIGIGPANDQTVFCVAKLVFAIEVTVFLILSIDIEVEAKQVTRVRGSLPESSLPDIV